MRPNPRHAIAALMLSLSLASPLQAQVTAPVDQVDIAPLFDADATRSELKTMLDGAVEAINARDLASITAYLDPDVLIIFQNGEIINGTGELQAFLDRMLQSDNAVLTAHETMASVARPADFHFDGKLAIGHGTVTDRFTFRGGKQVELPSRFMVTLKHTDQGWRAITIQFTANIFENPLLDAAGNFGWIKGGAGLAMGLILGLLVARRRKAKA